MSLSPIIEAYRLTLKPLSLFVQLTGVPVSVFDVAAALRLCLVLRQLRESALEKYQARILKGDVDIRDKKLEEESMVKKIATVLIVVYGGEAVMNPWLGLQPSFVFSPVIPGLYAALTVLVEYLPWVPKMSLKTEFPLSFMDGLTRAYLLCQLIPPVVTKHAMMTISSSPWTLLLSSLVTANGGFFFVGMFNMLEPTGFALSTPPELGSWGWTTVDLWCAPLATGIYALLTHAQPFWGELHGLLIAFLGSYGVVQFEGKEKAPAALVAEPTDSETARAICSVILTTLFVTRTLNNMGSTYMKELRGEKKKQVMRSKVDGRRYNASVKTKTQ